MTAELVRGQNYALPGTRLEIRVSAGTPVVAAVTLGDDRGQVIRAAHPGEGPGAGPFSAGEPAPPGQAGEPAPSGREGRGWLAHPGAPRLPGVEVPRQAAARHRLAVDPAAVPEEVHRVHVLLALPAGRPGTPADFGGAPAPHVSLALPDGTAVAEYTITGLGPETALLAVELYRRQGGWKVRAVGQGYAGGLPALFADQGVARAAEVAATVHAAASREQSRAVHAPRPAAPASAAGSPAASAPERAVSAGEGPAAPADYRHPRRGSGTGPVSTSARHAPGPDMASPQQQPAPPAPGIPRQPPHPAGPSVPAATGGADRIAGGGDCIAGGADRIAGDSTDGAGAPGPAAPPAPVAGDAPGRTMEERLYNQVWGMFEDLTRTVAAYRSAEDFAAARCERQLDALLSDPRTRGGPAAEAARQEAELRQMALVDQARAVLDRDLAQLTAESEAVEPALPPALAGWDSPAWHAYRVPGEPALALRLGTLTLPEAPELRIPLLARLPLERGLWVDSSEDPALAVHTAVALAARLLAVHPAGTFSVQVLDPAGSAATALAPLRAAGALAPAAAGAAAEVLHRLAERVDLVGMAVRGGAADALPPGVGTTSRLLIVNEFPYGFDERAVAQLCHLAEQGPAAGVHLLLVAGREDAAASGSVPDSAPVAGPGDPRRSLLRLTPLPSDHLADPWVGHAWTYEPSLVPEGSRVLDGVLRELAAARPAFGA